MKKSKNLEPILIGIFASLIIGFLAFLSFETSTGFWLMFSFGSTTLIVLIFYDSEFSQPRNIFFGHLLGISVGRTITLRIYLKVVHPPAAANPLIALFADVSFEYILFPVIMGTVVIIILSFIMNKIILKRNFPKKWF